MKTSVKVTTKSGCLYMLVTHNGTRKWQKTGLKLTGVKSKDVQIQKSAGELARQLEAELILGTAEIINTKTDFMKYFEEQCSLKADGNRSFAVYKKLAEYLRVNNIAKLSFDDITEVFISKFHRWCREVRKNKDNTIAVELIMIKAILNKAKKQKLIKSHNLEFFRLKREDTSKVFLTTEELAYATEQNNFENKIVNGFIFACYTGLRYSDLRKLRFGDVSLEGDKYFLNVVQQKTKSLNRIPVPFPASIVLARHIGDNDSLIFPELHTKSTVHATIKTFFFTIGIDKHITFHTSRHTYGMLVYNTTRDVYVAKELLGHRDIKTTMIYAKMSDASKVEAVQAVEDEMLHELRMRGLNQSKF